MVVPEIGSGRCYSAVAACSSAPPMKSLRLVARNLSDVLSGDGEVFVPMQETLFASRFAMLRETVGTSWTLLHPRPRST
jgi:hypothetical protein